MTAQIIHLRSDDNIDLSRPERTEADIGMLALVRFMSACPKCKDLRSQEGFGSRTLLRLLTGRQPIEAYCVVCDEFWPISDSERAALAERLEG